MPDRLTGTVTLHNANWKTDTLPTAVEISQATLHLGGGSKCLGSGGVCLWAAEGNGARGISACSATDAVQPTVNLEFADLDAAELQTTLLGAEKKGTLLSTLIARLTPTSTHTWPAFQGTLKADSLVLGPVKLQQFKADVKVAAAAAEITSLDAGLLGGQIHLTGKVENSVKPAYSLEGNFEKVNRDATLRIAHSKCTGMSFDGNGSVDLAGYTGTDLASSARGTLHFDWKKGTVSGQSAVMSQPC